MSRNGTPEYEAERAFLDETLALVDRRLARRVRAVTRDMPELADEVRERVSTPVQEWSRPVSPEIVMEFRGLKLEQAMIAELLQAIEARSLVEALERRIRAVERRELELVHRESGGLYLRDAEYWRDEDALAVLNRLFTNWARWARGERLEGP